MLIGGIALIAAYAFERDDDGYFTSDRQHLESADFAVTTEDIDLGEEAIDWIPDEVPGDIRMGVEAPQPVFVGIGRDDAVDRYLDGVAYD